MSADNGARAWVSALRCPAPDVAHHELAIHVRAVEDAVVAVVRVGELAQAAEDGEMESYASTAETALVRIGDALDRVRRLLIQEEARRG